LNIERNGYNSINPNIAGRYIFHPPPTHLGIGPGDVSDMDLVSEAILVHMSVHPGGHVSVHGVRGHHQEAVCSQLGHREVRLHQTAVIQPLIEGKLWELGGKGQQECGERGLSVCDDPSSWGTLPISAG